LTRPATRSALDVAFWLLERGVMEGWPLPPKRLRAMLYLAQAEFADRHGRKLMPATFLVTLQGPLEPTVTLVMGSGLKRPWAPALPPAAAEFMEDFWQRLGRTATSDLQKLVSRHPAWIEAWRNGPGSEVAVAAPTRASAMPSRRPGAPGVGAAGAGTEENGPEDQAPGAAGPAGGEPHFSDPELESARRRQDGMEPEPLHLKDDEVRFTLDGRRVTKWRPLRRIN